MSDYWDEPERDPLGEDPKQDEPETPDLVETPDPWPSAVSGLELAEDVRAAFLAHVVFPSDADADAATLWAFGTYFMGIWRLWPKLLVQSPEKQCGKSTLLEEIEAHVWRGYITANITAAALFRIIEQWEPTLLIDEADRFLRNNEEANGILNAGHTRRHARVIRTVEVKGNHVPRAFSVWGAQVIATIGSQMDTLEDRSIRIGLRRRLSSEKVAKRPTDYFERRLIVRRKLARWADDNRIRIGALDMEAPDCGNHRAQDNWTPLFRIAAVLGGPWPERVSRAYLLKEASDGERDEPAGVMLLRDIMGLFEERGTDRLQSADIVSALVEMEDRPWPEWKQGKPLTANSVSRLLKRYGIRPRKIRFGAMSLNGYERGAIEAAFVRYCPQTSPQTGTPEQSNENNGLGAIQTGTESENVPDWNGAKPLKTNNCSGVPDGMRGLGEDWEGFE
ncbi:DUF3631 domain-containing protein [Limibaculum sp. M0105]|uniref:DUF3631 domain-containing protein n=1 Tax=Thermohalobaculum xanthum TaxID=2753746 RepID=A0A8J7SFF5_9RHOB|nr:DUF3631 domain-containing protein [Thermohalobaculum xanthum]MBK0399507.1 DUF3631 domain-containing protein [Thermohalobaculum xanthum]